MNCDSEKNEAMTKYYDKYGKYFLVSIDLDLHLNIVNDVSRFDGAAVNKLKKICGCKFEQE